MLKQQSIIQTRQYIFDDVYGSEKTRETFSSNPDYGYFNVLLKIHNKYYGGPNDPNSSQTIYQNIFQKQSSPTRYNQSMHVQFPSTQFKPSIKHKILMNMEKINARTYKLYKVNNNLEQFNTPKKDLSFSNDLLKNEKKNSIVNDRKVISTAINSDYRKKKQFKSYSYSIDLNQRQRSINKQIKIGHTLVVIRNNKGNSLQKYKNTLQL